MTDEQKDKLEYDLEQNEGHLYAVLFPYQRVKHIEDKKFQELRMRYIEARHAILKYIGHN